MINVFNILINEIRQGIKEKKAMFLMTLFPIILIAVLGTALSTYSPNFRASYMNTDITLKNNSVCSENIVDGKYKYVKVKSFKINKSPNSLNYYSVSIATLMILYAALAGGFSMISENRRNTKNRILSAPVKRYELFIGKLMGVLVVAVFQMLFVLLTTKYFLQAYWGDDIISIIALMISEIWMAVAFGVGIAFITKNEISMKGIISFMIPVIGFLGGAYYPIPSDGFLRIILKLSPLTWTNNAIFQIIYEKNYSNFVVAMSINLIIGFIFIIIASNIYRREVAI